MEYLFYKTVTQVTNWTKTGKLRGNVRKFDVEEKNFVTYYQTICIRIKTVNFLPIHAGIVLSSCFLVCFLSLKTF